MRKSNRRLIEDLTELLLALTMAFIVIGGLMIITAGGRACST